MKQNQIKKHMNNSFNQNKVIKAEGQVNGSRNVNIAHMDAKYLVQVWLFSFLALMLLLVFGYVFLQAQISSLNKELLNTKVELVKIQASLGK